jgi:peptide/nickel transport system substrate-binding protein
MLKTVFSVLSNKEKRAVTVFSLLIVLSGSFLGVKAYYDSTQEVAADGGTYIEAMVGQTRFINPILSQTNDIDADLSSILFSSLLKTDAEGKLQNDLADSYEISDDKLTYTFHLKQTAKWHDGKPVTADDVIYTIKTIQDDNYYSPLIVNWKGVQTERVDDYTMRFILKNAYSPFLNNLTFGILPQHLWSQISSNEFPLSELNFKPIGSGPYKFDSYKKDKNGKIISLNLVANEQYYGSIAHIKKITFKFYDTENDAITAFNRKEVKGINYLSPANTAKVSDIKNKQVYKLNIPRYFAIFFNQTQSKALADKTVRQALAFALDKQKIVADVLGGEGTVVDSPIPEGLLGHKTDVKIYDHAVEHANNLLQQSGWIDGDGDGIREKGADKLQFTLTVSDNTEISKTAALLQSMWKEVGADVKIETTGNVQEDNIKTRDYEAVLFGEILNFDPDPFSFWHSSQKKDPGLNLALYDNPDVDKILDEARKETNPDVRAQKYQQFQDIIVEDEPAIFLYSPNYIYLQDKSMHGMDAKNIITPSDRFNNIENWYLKTRRIAK